MKLRKPKKNDVRLSKSGVHVTTCALLATLATGPALAFDVDAGDYTALPAGTNLGIVYYQTAERNKLYNNGSRAAGNPGLDSDVGILRGVHFMDIGGYIVDPQFLLPFGKLKAKGDTSVLGETSGGGDLILAATVWLVNQKESNTYFGITPFLTLPTGQYNRNNALNLGENRTKFTLQAGYITSLTKSISLDLIGDVTVYGRNDDFGATSATLKQEATYAAQAHLRYHISPTFDIRAGLFKTFTGETRVNGVDQDDRGITTKFNIGTSYFIRPTTQLLATYGRDISVREGFKENNRLNLRLLQVF